MNKGTEAKGTVFGQFVVKRADGKIEDLGYHVYDCPNPWKALLLDHNDLSKDDGLRKYWNQSRKYKAILKLRLLARKIGIK